MKEADSGKTEDGADPLPHPHARPRTWHKMIAWQDELARRESGEEDNAWLVTYLDMLTLLITVFVVMLAYSTFQPDKFTRLKEAVSTEAGGESKPTAAVQAGTPPDPAQVLAQRLASQLGQAGMLDAVKIEVEDARLTLQIQEKILFSSGRAELNGQGNQVLDGLAPMFMAPGQMISVEGHTDNIPINTGMFPSNWELSASRASRVVRYLVERGVPTNRLRAVGYGEMRPLADNASEQGRTTNRRVSIVIDLAVVKTSENKSTGAGEEGEANQRPETHRQPAPM